MAKNEAPPPVPGGAPASKKSLKLIIIAVAALVLLVGAGGTAFLLMTKDHESEDTEHSSDEKPKKKKSEKEHAKPAYFTLEPFTVNLVSEGSEQYLQLVMALDMHEESEVERAKAFTPKLRNDVMMLLSAKKAADISTREGKEALALEIKNQVNGVLDPSSKGKKEGGPVREILFTSFIVQ